MRGWLGLGFVIVACAAACGGATQSDLFGPEGTSSGATTSSGGDPPGTTPTATATTTTPPPTTQPCATTTYYRDRDGDGFGGTETKVACSSPGKEYVTKGGDCDDDNPDVFPGQTEYFTEAYTPKSGGSGPTFDYDCSKKEEQPPPAKTKASACTLVGNACTGSGYVAPGRSTPGGGITGDPLCGATKYQVCELSVTGGPPSCKSTIVTAESPVSCH